MKSFGRIEKPTVIEVGEVPLQGGLNFRFIQCRTIMGNKGARPIATADSVLMGQCRIGRMGRMESCGEVQLERLF